jgi:AraC-like DNA-binding protein
VQGNAHGTVDTPAVTVVEITDPTATQQGFELIDQDAVQLQSLPLRARRVVVRLATATVVLHSTNRRVRTRTRISQGLLGYATFGPRAKGTVNGLPVRRGLVLAAESGAEVTLVVDPGWESINILVSPDDLRAHFAARGRAHEFRIPNGIEALQADPTLSRGLFDWGKRLTTTAARHPAIFNRGRDERGAAQAELVEKLLPVLRAAGQVEPSRVDRTAQARGDIVTTAERYALSRIGESLSVTDLCLVTGVSERTLEYAFRDVLGLTPVAYLTRLRLHRVRRSLLAAEPGSTTVSAQALRWGFWHFGEFSRAYRDCFGELPSETLRRPSHESR